jgi:hypothetical protein
LPWLLLLDPQATMLRVSAARASAFINGLRTRCRVAATHSLRRAAYRPPATPPARGGGSLAARCDCPP